MDELYVIEVMDLLNTMDENELVEVVEEKLFGDEMRLAAALLLCTCDSNERKAE